MWLPLTTSVSPSIREAVLVWFSLEGAPQWVKNAAQIFPLTHILSAVRRIMHDGAELLDVGLEIIILSVMTLAFLGVGA